MLCHELQVTACQRAEVELLLRASGAGCEHELRAGRFLRPFYCPAKRCAGDAQPRNTAAGSNRQDIEEFVRLGARAQPNGDTRRRRCRHDKALIGRLLLDA